MVEVTLEQTYIRRILADPNMQTRTERTGPGQERGKGESLREQTGGLERLEAVEV